MSTVKKYTAIEIEQIIKDYIINEFLYDKPNIVLSNDLPLIESGMNDSLGIFILADFITKKFGITLNTEELLLENFGTVNAIKSLIMSKL
ncbi:acyl carrier protein [Nostoc sp. CHAB 5844]|nr:acyl carrier protein [Nostoc sp. CHAB 5844]